MCLLQGDWLWPCGISHMCSRCLIQVQSQASTVVDGLHAVNIYQLFYFRSVVKLTDTVFLSSLPQPSAAPCHEIRSVLKTKHFRMEFFWSPNCSCDYRRIDTSRCPQPARPAGTGNDAIQASLTLTGPIEATASLTRKMLSISAAGWLCPVIVMPARLWHFCHVDGKCLSSHPLAGVFEFSSTLMDSSWGIVIKKMKPSFDPKCRGCCHCATRPTVSVTKATAQPLPRGCCPLAVVSLLRG